MRLPLLLSSFLLAAACSRPAATDTAQSAGSPRDSLVAAAVGPGGFGGVRGQLVPAGVEAVIHVTAAGADTQVIGPTFSDPLSGAFTADELPVDVYRVEVAPLDPAYAPRVFEGVVVPHDEVRDLGTVDLHRDPADTPSRKGGRGLGDAR